MSLLKSLIYFIDNLLKWYRGEIESKLSKETKKIPKILLDYYEASMGNHSLASYDQDKPEINNVTFWFQLYLGSVKMITDMKPGEPHIIPSNDYSSFIVYLEFFSSIFENTNNKIMIEIKKENQKNKLIEML